MDDVYAAGLLVLVLGLLAGAARRRRASLTPPDVVAGVVCGLLCALATLFWVHRCLKGQPVLLALVVVPTAALCIPRFPSRLRWLVVAAVVGSTLLLGSLHGQIVHDDRFTGNRSVAPERVEPRWHSFFTGIYRLRRATEHGARPDGGPSP